ncbi:MFS general substrate transporter [Marasmius fiardii PR-910]|nr:MFS general substrate transporter [Marasmius fiardii PR-910]
MSYASSRPNSSGHAQSSNSHSLEMAPESIELTEQRRSHYTVHHEEDVNIVPVKDKKKKEQAERASVEVIQIDEQQEQEEIKPLSTKPTLEAWMTVAGVFLIQLSTMGLVSAFGVFQEFYTGSWLTNVSSFNISWIGTVPLFLGFGFGLVGGRIFDKGYIRHTMIAGSLLFIVCFFLLSLVKPGKYYQVFLPQGLGAGFSLMLVYAPSFSVVAVQFKELRALAMGIVSAASPLGGVIYSIMFNNLFRSVGYAWAVRIGAFIALACLFVGNLLLRPPPRSPPASSHFANQSKPSLFRIIDLPYILVLISGFFLGIGTYYPLFFIQLFAVLHGVSETMSFYSVAIMNFACFIGRIAPNYMADKLGVLKIAIPCIVLNGVVCFAMLGATSVVGVVMFSIVYGFFLGASISLYLPVVYFVTPRGMDLGRSMGIGLGPVGLGLLIGSPVISATQRKSDTEYDWWKGVTLAGVVLIAAGVIMSAAVAVHKRRVRRAEKMVMA